MDLNWYRETIELHGQEMAVEESHITDQQG